MAFNVRIFGYRGISQIPRVNPQQAANDSVQVLVEPYEWAQLLTTNGLVAQSSAAQAVATDKTTIIRIEVADGNTIRYEINPPNRAVAASPSSPSLSGKDQFFFGAGWTVSIIDAATAL